MNSLPTIALISVHSDPARETGSQNVYVRQLGLALSRLGWQVDMFTRKTSLSQANIVQHNSSCRTIRLTAGALRYVPRQKLIGYLPEFVKQLRQFQQDNRVQYSLIHTNYWLSAWVGMQLKKTQPLKHIHTYHSLGAVKYARTNSLSNLAKTRLAVEKICLETADLTIATCPQQREYLRELVSIKGNIEIIPCGTDTNTFGSVARVVARQKLAIEPDIFNILYVGRFDYRQGIETLLKAVSKSSLHALGKVKLTLASNSHPNNQLQKKYIEQLAWDLGIDSFTTFVEPCNREEMATYYAAANVCVVPSYYSSSGMVAIEAMASGTPVIASNVGDLKYIVAPEQTGLLFSPGNAAILTRAIARMVNEPQWCVQLGRAARERVEELFTWDDVAQQLSEYYLEFIKVQNRQLLNRSLQYSVQAISA